MKREEVAQMFNLLTDEEQEKLIDKIGASCNTDEIIVQYLNETVLIYDTTTDYYLTWYKLTHIGRCLKTNITNPVRVYGIFKDILEN